RTREEKAVLKQSLSADDKIILDRLLSKWAGSLNGALDFWTLVCLGKLGMDPRAFVLKQGEIMRSLLVVTKTILDEANFKEPVRRLLDTLFSGSEKWQNAFLVLAAYQTVSLEEVRAAVQTVSDLYGPLRETLRQFGQALQVPVSFLQNQ